MTSTRRSALRARRRPRPDGSPQRRAWLTIALAVALFALGAIVGRASQPGVPAERTASPAPASRVAPRPHAAVRTPAGAVSAATAFLDTLRWDVLLDGARRRAALERFAARGASARLDARLSPGLPALRDAVSARPVVARPVPVGYRVRRFTARRAVVSVWGMALFGSAAYEPVTQWATSTLQLAWQRGEWRVAAMDSRPGPSPRWSIEELARGAASFEPYRHVP